MFPERKCSDCTLANKEHWGCNSKPAIPDVVDGEELERCVARPILDDPHFFNEAFNVYRNYQKGFLPNEGSINAQPTALMQIINTVDVALYDCKEAKDEADRRKKANRERMKMVGTK